MASPWLMLGTNEPREKQNIQARPRSERFPGIRGWDPLEQQQTAFPPSSKPETGMNVGISEGMA